MHISLWLNICGTFLLSACCSDEQCCLDKAVLLLAAVVTCRKCSGQKVRKAKGLHSSQWLEGDIMFPRQLLQGLSSPGHGWKCGCASLWGWQGFWVGIFRSGFLPPPSPLVHLLRASLVLTCALIFSSVYMCAFLCCCFNKLIEVWFTYSKTLQVQVYNSVSVDQCTLSCNHSDHHGVVNPPSLPPATADLLSVAMVSYFLGFHRNRITQ